MGLRRKGRELALQTLYSLQYEEMDSYLGELAFLSTYKMKMAEIIEGSSDDPSEKSIEFAEELMENMLKNLAKVDELIKQHLINWDFDRISPLDKNLMRLATYEIALTKTPPPIVINEAIEIAKKFCSEQSSKFLNGVLNSIAQTTRN